eukprot:2311672-Amphidinium_carterae.1
MVFAWFVEIVGVMQPFTRVPGRTWVTSEINRAYLKTRRQPKLQGKAAHKHFSCVDAHPKQLLRQQAQLASTTASAASPEFRPSSRRELSPTREDPGRV